MSDVVAPKELSQLNAVALQSGIYLSVFLSVSYDQCITQRRVCLYVSAYSALGILDSSLGIDSTQTLEYLM